MADVTALRKKSRMHARRANKKVAPVASDARDTVVRAAGTSYDWAAPKVEATMDWAAPKVEATIDWAGPKVEATKDWAAPRMEPAMTKVKEDVLPRVAEAVAAALTASEPAREEAKLRGTAALAALRGELDPPPTKRRRRAKRFFVFVAISGAAAAAWKAWSASKGTNRPEPWVTPTPVPAVPPVVSVPTDEAIDEQDDE
jgi:Family of unknown function (DUF5324)